MTPEEHQAHLALQGLQQTPDIPEDVDLPDFAQDNDVLHGHTALDISHAGELIPEDEADQDDVDLLQELREHHNQLFASRSRHQQDCRTQHNRTQIIVDVFAAQLEKMTDVYMDWSLAMVDKGLGGDYMQPEGSVEEDRHPVWVVDLFSAYYQAMPIIDANMFSTSVFVWNGLTPCSPHEPSVVVTVDKHVKAMLRRDTPNWRLKNACPTCMYKLKGEALLKLPLITTQVGNNSMKRFWC
ncbi:hypothetical protein DFH08DRAFT_799427 [Mycena albidolilacea]|uniref:Uncharacterized protein n=1 Tax=Mycena albidolilacea TaxID=1033008 RepID=A0AAD7AMR3_9AGAR|nr:hypothetical protein DFH08DRAFT_799427 [Mycena albidolilacea]